MDPARPGAGTLLAKYLVGLICLVVGLAVILVGVFNQTHGTIWVGFVLAAVGAFLIALKIIARNPPDPLTPYLGRSAAGPIPTARPRGRMKFRPCRTRLRDQPVND